MRLFLIFLLSLFIILPANVHAKTLPQAKKAIKSSGPANFNSTVKLRRDRKAVTIFLSGFKNVSSVSYMLVYETNGKQEGVAGSISPKNQTSTSRELLFGTCSSGVCRYHPNVKNATLEISYQLTTGKQGLKRYRIRV